MITQIYSLLDLKTGAYSRPFYTHYDAQAIRDVIGLVEAGENHVARHPADFNLMGLGVFDDETGGFMPCVPRVLGNVASFIARAPMPLFSHDAHEKVHTLWREDSANADGLKAEV